MTNLPDLPKYDEQLLRKKILPLTGRDSLVDKIALWWQAVPAMADWIAQAQKAFEALPKGSPEKRDASAAFAGCAESFSEINTKLASLLATPDPNVIKKLWIQPIVGFFKELPEEEKLDELIGLIVKFKNKYWNMEIDQIFAASEAINACRHDLTVARQMIAQWGMEEFFSLPQLQELYYLHHVGREQSTLDDMETELRELSDALAGELWTKEKTEKFRRIFNELRKGMDKLKVETKIKTGFDEMFEYATGEIGKSVSAFDILMLVEKVWLGFKNDNTLHRYWEYKHRLQEGE